MGKRRQSKKQAKQQAGEGGQELAGAPQAATMSEPEYQRSEDPARAVLAVHPQRGVIAVAVGPELRVYDSK